MGMPCFARVFTVLLCLLLGLGACRTAQATTYYVRDDGGSAVQCTGLSNAAYAGSGNAQPCAWKHPFYAMPPGGTPRIAGGDTLLISPGSYKMGYGALGTEKCSKDWPWDCAMPAIPSGPSALAPTRILGSAHSTGCSVRPELWGSERASQLLNLKGSSNVEVACLELTDHDECILDHNAAHAPAPKAIHPPARGLTFRCNRPDGLPEQDYADNGIAASDSRNVVLRDLDIHGFAGNGIIAGRLKDWTLQSVKIVANGWAGWNGDIHVNDSKTESRNTGSMIFRNVEIAWNGCTEDPDTKQKLACWGQENGGYGDGLGTGFTSGNWLFEDLYIHHNTSDGLDLLYVDDIAASITVRRARAEGNGGNQLKVNGNAVIENSIVIGDCAFFGTFPTSNIMDGDQCRAAGNTLSLGAFDNSITTVRHNTITGQGDCQILTDGGNASARIRIQNNAIIGDTDWRQPFQLTCGHYPNTGQKAAVVFNKNLFWNVKDNQCPAGSVCGKNPLLTRPVYGNYDARPRPGSPLIDSAAALAGVNTDFFGLPRPAGPAADIGAIEVQPSGPVRVTGGALAPRVKPGTAVANASAAPSTSSAAGNQPDGTLVAGVVEPIRSNWRSPGQRMAQSMTAAAAPAINNTREYLSQAQARARRLKERLLAWWNAP